MTRCTSIPKIILLFVAMVALCSQPIFAKSERHVGPKKIQQETAKTDTDTQRGEGFGEAEVNPNEAFVPYREGMAVGDNCASPIVVTLPAALPYADLNQTTCGRANDYSTTCLGNYDGGEDILYQIDVTAATTVIFSVDFKTTTYGGFTVDNACPPDASCLGTVTSSSTGIKTVGPLALAVGTYYVMVDTWPTPNCVPAFDFKITTPPDPTTCASPLVANVSAGTLPLVLDNLFTCGRGNDYSNTCMGNYDGGEDLIIKLDVTGPLFLDLTMDPKGTTYSAMAIDDVCPLDIATGSCIGFVGTSTGTTKSITGLTLNTGTYYVMFDTWPTPNCIPDFKLTITGGTPPPANDNCASAIAVGDVVDLPFNTTAATFDGPGACIASGVKNIWYCFTAPGSGNTTISTCNSSYDTKIAAYAGCSCPVGAPIACNDDACGSDGYKSSMTIPVVGGQQYMIEVGGYNAASSGAGLLTISTAVPPPNDDCEDVTPVVLTSGVPQVFTGNNTGASPDCASFPGNNVWEAFTLTECSDVTLRYCGTSPAFTNAWLNLAQGCPCASFTPGGDFEVSSCGDGNVSISWTGLVSGTYYYPVLTEPGATGPYTITVTANGVTSYCPADGFCDEYISRVQVGTIDNSSGCSSSYSDFTAVSTPMTQTVGYALTVTNGLAYTLDDCGVWVDWNGDMCFDATEAVTVSGGPASFTATVTPPLSSVSGPTRIRIRIVYDEALSPCGTSEYGEVEDYTVDIQPLIPVATISPNPQYLYYMFAVTPITNEFRFGNFNDGHSPSDVNLSTVKINGIPASSTVIVPSAPGFAGPSLLSTLPLTTFLPPYGSLFDVNNLTFTVSWDWNDTTPGSITDDVTIIGKSSPIPGSFIIPGGPVVLVPGDFDLSGLVTISDPVAIINYIFAGGSAPLNPMIGDADCSNLITISDAVYMVQYIFGGGAAPCAVGN